MEDRTKKFLLGGAALLGGAIFGWYFYEKHHPQPAQRTNSISKSLWMQILKEQEREFYSIFKVISDLSKEHIEKLRERNVILAPEAMQQTLFEDYPVIDEKMTEIIKRILERYGISEEEYLHALTVTFADDNDEKSVMQKFAVDQNNAFMGFAPELASHIPDFLTHEKTLEVVEKLNKVEMEKLREYSNEALDNEALFQANPLIATRFFCDARINLKISDEKREIFVEEGLDAFEEAPERILDTAIAKYMAENTKFQQEVEYLQRDRVAFEKTFGITWTVPNQVPGPINPVLMKSNTRNLLLGGAALLGGAVAWYFYNKTQLIKVYKPIPKEIMIKILKEQERESYSLLKVIATIFKELLEQQRQSAKDMEIPLEYIKQTAFMQYPNIEEKSNDIAQKVIEKYGFSYEDFYNAASVSFKDDQDVQKFLEKSQDDAEKSCNGIAPELASNIPEILTKEKVLQVLAKLIRQEHSDVERNFKTIDEQGADFFYDEGKAFNLIGVTRVDMKVNNEKKKIFVEEGLDAFEEAPEGILDAAIRKYREEDAEFRKENEELEKGRVNFMLELKKKLMEYVDSGKLQH